MLGETHRRITQTAAGKLKLPELIELALSEASEAPDRHPDYETRIYVNARGRVRTHMVRIRHHGTPLRVIKKTATKARHYLLKSEQAPPESEAGRLRKFFGRTREGWQLRAVSRRAGLCTTYRTM